MSKIEVVKLGEEFGCSFGDRISIEFSPNELERLEGIFERRSINSNDYLSQGLERDFKELFKIALNEWMERRGELQNGTD